MSQQPDNKDPDSRSPDLGHSTPEDAKEIQLPLFPLNAHIFPEGRMRLKIFEPRYLRMVRENAGRTPAFAMGMSGRRNPGGDFEVLPLATLVNVVDFEVLEGGLLGITIEGVEFAQVGAIETESDGLRLATLQPVPGWKDQIDDSERLIEVSYNQVREEFAELKLLYPTLERQPPNWYVYRWLELLPISAEDKFEVLAEPSVAAAQALLLDILRKSDLPGH